MTRLPLRRPASSLAFTVVSLALVLGCSKKAVPVEDAGAPPAPPPSAPQITELAPLDDDAGPGDAAGTGKKWTGGGGGYNTNQLKIRQCCAAMRAQAKVLGASSPEAVQIVGLAAQCDMFASQIGPQGNAPELNQLRQMLKSVKLPAACQM